MPSISTRSALSLAIVAAIALSGDASARDLGNFDINVASLSSKQRIANQRAQTLPVLQQSSDILGRAAFTWVQRDLPAAAKALTGQPEQAAQLHLAALLGAAKRAPTALQALQLVELSAQAGQAHLLRYRSQVNGIEVFQEELALLLDGQQRLVAMRGPLPRESTADGKALATFSLDASAAISRALQNYDFAEAEFARLKAAPVESGYLSLSAAKGRQSKSGALIIEAPRAKQVYYRTSSGLQPAWYVETQVADSPSSSADFYAYVISAIDGSTLFRHNQTAHAAAFTYRVWADGGDIGHPLPSPEGRASIPDPDGLQGHNQVPFVPSQLNTRANSLFSQSATDGWLEPGANTTSGNNVNAYADIAEPDGFGAGDLQPSTTVAATFDYSFDPNLDPEANTTQRMGATVQMFYWVNWLHDWFYDSGFNEAAGNAQVNNYGRGGLGGDAILAEAQDFAVRNNANMATPADGAAPRMQMGISTRAPIRDRTVSGLTVAHEWAHYFSNRLVGNSSGLSTEHSRGMGEGWSDFVGLLSAVQEADIQRPGNSQFEGAYAYASYPGVDSYYGIRRYPYSTDLNKNPLSLRHINDLEFLPNNPAPSFQGANSAVHNQGEVWASALWDCYAALLNDRSRLSFAEAQRRMKAYLVTALKMTPNAPTMTEARDALLAATLASGEQADFDLFTVAFAKRGLGGAASIPDRYSDSMAEVVESKDVGGDLAITASQLGVPAGCDADAALDLGETAMLTLTLRNTGFTALQNARINLTSTSSAISFPEGSSVNVGELPLFASKQVQVPVSLQQAVAPGSTISVTATPDADNILAPPGTALSVSTLVNFDVAARSSVTDEFAGLQSSWSNRLQSDNGGTAIWSLQTEGTISLVNGSDRNSLAVTWFESPRMATGAGPLSLQLKHRYAFEIDEQENYDGGLIEVSTDDGATWTAIDASAAGFAVKPLSACCRNPMAGRQAFVGINPLYPVFEEQTINLGTAYANQANFRIRFGVATDASVNVRGWDIDRISISGLSDTPFSQLIEQSPSCSVASHKTLQGGMSGTYYDPQRSGEGVLADFGKIGDTPIVFFTWYTYEDGQQRWLVGSAPFGSADTVTRVDLISTSGAQFGEAFRSSDVLNQPWGTVSQRFIGCDTLEITYQRNDGATATQQLTRGLERLQGGECR